MSSSPENTQKLTKEKLKEDIEKLEAMIDVEEEKCKTASAKLVTTFSEIFYDSLINSYANLDMDNPENRVEKKKDFSIENKR